MKQLAAIVLVFGILASPAAYADPVQQAMPIGIRASIAKARFRDHGDSTHYFIAQPASTMKNSVAQKVGASLAMGVLGILAGGLVGGQINPCKCQDGNLGPALIGMDVGGAAGAALGWWLASK